MSWIDIFDDAFEHITKNRNASIRSGIIWIQFIPQSKQLRTIFGAKLLDVSNFDCLLPRHHFRFFNFFYDFRLFEESCEFANVKPSTFKPSAKLILLWLIRASTNLSITSTCIFSQMEFTSGSLGTSHCWSLGIWKFNWNYRLFHHFIEIFESIVIKTF